MFMGELKQRTSGGSGLLSRWCKSFQAGKASCGSKGLTQTNWSWLTDIARRDSIARPPPGSMVERLCRKQGFSWLTEQHTLMEAGPVTAEADQASRILAPSPEAALCSRLRGPCQP